MEDFNVSQWVQALHRIGAQGLTAVMVTIASGKGSTPREAGAKMVVTLDALHGTIGGGDVEFQAIEIAREMLRETDARRSKRFPLGASFGQYCGGAANLAFELVPAGAEWVGLLCGWLEAGPTCVMVTPAQDVGIGGRLFVRGPNVMLGYLRVENPGVLERPDEGWHDTGDIVSIDAGGFITIKARAKRFAKVGGEMISLAGVEMLAAELWPEAVSGVATIPDLRKGERIVLVTTRKDASRSEFIAFVRQKGASEMMIPGEFVVLDKLPLLGAGKVDSMALTKLVRERYLEGAA